MKTKPIKAHRCSSAFAGTFYRPITEVFVLPDDAKSYDAMVGQIAHAIDPEAESLCGHFEERMKAGSQEPWYDYRLEAKQKATAALKSIGITRPAATPSARGKERGR